MSEHTSRRREHPGLALVVSGPPARDAYPRPGGLPHSGGSRVGYRASAWRALARIPSCTTDLTFTLLGTTTTMRSPQSGTACDSLTLRCGRTMRKRARAARGGTGCWGPCGSRSATSRPRSSASAPSLLAASGRAAALATGRKADRGRRVSPVKPLRSASSTGRPRTWRTSLK